jgi:hypothetical protein
VKRYLAVLWLILVFLHSKCPNQHFSSGDIARRSR